MVKGKSDDEFESEVREVEEMAYALVVSLNDLAKRYGGSFRGIRKDVQIAALLLTSARQGDDDIAESEAAN